MKNLANITFEICRGCTHIVLDEESNLHCSLTLNQMMNHMADVKLTRLTAELQADRIELGGEDWWKANVEWLERRLVSHVCPRRGDHLTVKMLREL